jgi:trimeric autotransporter adhesin
MNKFLLQIGFFLTLMATSFASNPLDVACPTPNGLFAATRDTVAVLNWRSTGTTNGYTVQWKLKRDTEWKSANATVNTLLIKSLAPCNEYEFRVKSICALGEMSGYSEAEKFKTIGCAPPCTTPNSLGAEMGDTKAVLKWRASGATKYEVQYREVTTVESPWKTETTVAPVLPLANLKVCTKYQFRVRSVCSATVNSEWSSSATVTTTGCSPRCNAPRKLYTTLSNSNNVISLKWDSIPNATYDVQIKSVTDTAWRTVSGIRTASYTPTGLANCTVYQARLKVNCSATSSSDWSYIIVFKTGGCPPVCIKPEGIKSFVSDTVAIVSWSSRQVSKYVLQYKLDTETAWKSINVADNYYILTGLTRCKKYNVRVQAVCSATSSSDYSSTSNFETKCQAAAVCAVPTLMRADIVRDTTAILTWLGFGSKYDVQFRIKGTATWTDVTANVNRSTHTLTGLKKCTNYEWRVRTQCTGNSANNISSWTEAQNFKTTSCLMPDIESSSSVQSKITTTSVYPNPGQAYVQLTYTLEAEAQVSVQLLNAQGQIVKHIVAGNQEAGQYMQVIDEINDVPTGLYFIHVLTDGKVAVTQKWVKQ